MTVVIEDVVQVNLVLVGINLVNTPENIEAFSNDASTDLTVTAIGVGANPINRTIEMHRDRISVTVTQDRSVIARDYPAALGDLQRLTEISVMAISNTDFEGQQLRAFGFNIDLVFEHGSEVSAIRYLSDRLFKPGLMRGEGFSLLGGSASIFLQKNDLYWRANLEPRFGDNNALKVFLSLNLNRSETDLSILTDTEIRVSFDMLWEEAHNLVNRLDAEDIG